MTLPTTISSLMNKDLGDSFQIGAGNITRLDPNTYQWANNYGQTHNIYAPDAYSLAQKMYKIPSINELWGSGALNDWNAATFNSAVNPAPTPTAPSSTFEVSPNPFMTSQMTSNQNSSSSSKSGINWSLPFLKDLQPRLLGSADTAINAANNMSGILQDQYANLMRRGMGPEAFQGTLNQLAARGMTNSSVAGDAMASTSKGIAKMIADQMFQSLLAGEQSKMQIPSILAQLAQLGQESRSSSGSSGSSQSTTWQPPDQRLAAEVAGLI